MHKTHTQTGIIPSWVIIPPPPALHAQDAHTWRDPQVSHHLFYPPPHPSIACTRRTHRDGLSLGESSSPTPVLYAQDAHTERGYHQVCHHPPPPVLHAQDAHTERDYAQVCQHPPPPSISCTRRTHREGLCPGVSASPSPQYCMHRTHTQGGSIPRWVIILTSFPMKITNPAKYLRWVGGTWVGGTL